MKAGAIFFGLVAALWVQVQIRGADVSISGLPVISNVSTNTKVEVADMNATPHSRGALIQDVVTSVFTPTAQAWVVQLAGRVQIVVTNLADAQIASGAAIARGKVAAGTAGQVVVNAGDGTLTSEAQLAKSRGGTGADNSAVTYPSTGIVVTEGAVETLSSKTLNTPTIASLVNAQHNHQSGAGGGVLDGAAIGTGTVAKARGGAGADMSSVTFPGSGVLVTEGGTETLTAKTLTTPTIGSFVNAGHTHQNAAGGGVLDAAAIGTGTVAKARGGAGADMSSVTFPGSGVLVTEGGTETLTAKTLTTPTIASFVNAVHNHQNAAGGGTIDASIYTPVNLGSGPAYILDPLISSCTATPSGDFTFTLGTNAVSSGNHYHIYVYVYDAAGGKKATLTSGGTGGAAFAGAAATFGTGTNAVGTNIYHFAYVGGAWSWDQNTAQISAVQVGNGSVSDLEFGYLDGVTSPIQTQFTGKENQSANLDALSALASNGLIARTGSGTVAVRTVTAGTGISISNGDGVSGNPTVSASSVPNAALQNSSITVLGTANQVVVSGSPVALGGTVTLSGPQDLASGSSPAFAGLTLSSGDPLSLGNGTLGKILRIANGTAGSPDTGTNPLVTIFRTMDVAAANVVNDGRENSPGLLIVNRGTAHNYVQPIGLTAIAFNFSTNAVGGGNDSLGMFGIGYNPPGNIGNAIGGCFIAYRGDALGGGQALQLQTYNLTNSDTYISGGFPKTSLITGGAAGGAGHNSAVAFSIGNIDGAQFLYGIDSPAIVSGGKTGGIATAMYADHSTAVAMIEDHGTHTYGADFNGGTYSAGAIRIPNNVFMVGRNAAGSGDVNTWKVNASNLLVPGTSIAPLADATYLNGSSGAKWLAEYSYNFIGGQFTPAQITSNQNDYNPGSVVKFLKLSSDASRNITGFSIFQSSGQEHYDFNDGSQNIVLTNEDALSTAANRIRTSTGASLTITTGKTAYMWYDGAISRWRASLMN